MAYVETLKFVEALIGVIPISILAPCSNFAFMCVRVRESARGLFK